MKFRSAAIVAASAAAAVTIAVPVQAMRLTGIDRFDDVLSSFFQLPPGSIGNSSVADAQETEMEVAEAVKEVRLRPDIVNV